MISSVYGFYCTIHFTQKACVIYDHSKESKGALNLMSLGMRAGGAPRKGNFC